MSEYYFYKIYPDGRSEMALSSLGNPLIISNFAGEKSGFLDIINIKGWNASDEILAKSDHPDKHPYRYYNGYIRKEASLDELEENDMIEGQMF